MNKNPNPDKSLGQHYLKDKTVIRKIMEDAPNDFDLIVEIGPGPATLTKDLNDFNKPLYLIEMDNRFDPYFESLENIKHVYFEDALNFDWISFCEIHPGKIWLVSNLPYNISSQLFLSFLKVPAITHMTLMYQKEVGEKTLIRQGTKNQMGSLLSLSLAFMESKNICKVAPGAFNPPPKVDSIVVSYERLLNPKIPIENFKHFESFLRLLFSNKRKQIARVLKAESLLIEKLKSQNFDLTRRAETLEFSEVLSIYALQ